MSRAHQSTRMACEPRDNSRHDVAQCRTLETRQASPWRTGTFNPICSPALENRREPFVSIVHRVSPNADPWLGAPRYNTEESAPGRRLRVSPPGGCTSPAERSSRREIQESRGSDPVARGAARPHLWFPQPLSSALTTGTRGPALQSPDEHVRYQPRRRNCRRDLHPLSVIDRIESARIRCSNGSRLGRNGPAPYPDAPPGFRAMGSRKSAETLQFGALRV